MRKNIFVILTVSVMLLFAFVFGSVNVSAEEDYDTLKSATGNTVCYYNTSTPIKIPKAYTERTEEFRGAWVSFYAGDLDSYITKEQMMNQLNDILETFEHFNMNAMLFHIRTHNDVYYNSDIAPMNSSVSACNFEEWDYLEWLIDECHKRGIEFHAWLNPYRITSTETTEEYIRSKYANYPNNPASDLSNVLMSDDGSILDPGIPKVVDYINDVVLEIIEKYDVDAIHFDDYFYISNVDDSKTRAKYNTKNLSTDTFRREAVNNLISSLDKTIDTFNKKHNKAIQFGISPTGVYRNGNYISPNSYVYNNDGTLKSPTYSGSAGYSHYDNPLYADSKYWIDKGWIDYIIPQCYNPIDLTQASVAALADWWSGVVKNTKCNLYIGIGYYKTDEKGTTGWQINQEELLYQLRYNNQYSSIKGTCIYQYQSLERHKSSTVLRKLVNEYWTHKVKCPVNLNYENMYDNDVVKNVKVYKKDSIIAFSFAPLEDARRYLVIKYEGDYNYNNRANITSLIGVNEYLGSVIYTDIEYNSKYKYAIIPVSMANTLGDVLQVDLSAPKDIDFEIGSVSINVGSPSYLGGSFTILFYAPIVYVGDEAKYDVLVSYDKDFKDYTVLFKDEECIQTNVRRLSGDKDGMVMYIKVVCHNSLGTFESEVKSVGFSDDVFSIMDYIFAQSKAGIEDLIN